MNFKSVLLVSLLTVSLSTRAGGQNWRIVTPEESELISSNTGERILFPLVLLPTGMRYRVRASNAARTSNSGDSCDARYYYNMGVELTPNSLFPNTGLKIRYDGVNETYFQPPIAVPYQNGYQASHIYDASVLSRGTILAFRFFDRVDPPSMYYDDNRDFIAINVARETPGIAVYQDTLDFGAVGVSTTKMLPDSIQSYGREALNVTNVNVTGSGAFTFTSERGTAFQLAESLTNAFAVTFAPTVFGAASAKLHIHTSNGFGQDTDRIIVLLGTGRGAALSRTPDTLDFGSVRVGSSKSLNETVSNLGNTDARIVSATVTPNNFWVSVAGLPVTVTAQNSGLIPVTFAPLGLGPVLVKVDALADDGTVVEFFAKGIGRGGTFSRTPDTLDFGLVRVGSSKTLNETISNLDNSDAKIVAASVTPFNVKFFVNGLPVTLPALNSGQIPVTFSPTSVGAVIAKVDVTADDGTIVEFYVKGTGAMGTLYLSADTLDFGTVLFGKFKSMIDTMINVGNVALDIQSVTNTSPGAFTVIGNTSARQIPAFGSGDIYTITFAPNIHIPSLIHTALLTFTYDGGKTRTVFLIGREHTPLEADLRIDTSYFEKPGSDVTVYQRLTSDLSATITPVQDIKEKIFFNTAVLQLQSVSKGSAISASDWNLTSTTPTAGEIDITAHATQSRLGGIGAVLLLHFHVLESAQPGDLSDLPQQSVTLGGGPEPTVVVEPGRVHVIGTCGPVQLLSGTITTSIEPNSPNPVRSSTIFNYWLNEASPLTHVRLQIFNQLGVRVKTIVDEDEPNGSHAVTLDAGQIQTGMYTYVFDAGRVHQAMRLMVIR